MYLFNKSIFAKQFWLVAILAIGISQANGQVPNYVPTNGLVGWWPFNGNANDESGNGNNGTVNGATLTSDRNGVANAAYNFDGINDEIYTTRSGVTDFSISAWYYINQNQTYSAIVDAYNANWEVLCKQFDPGYIEWNGISYNERLSGSTITLNTWNQITITYQGSLLKIFLNGQLIQTFTGISLINSNGSFYFGHSKSGSSQFLNGKLDDIGFWNRALTTFEVGTLYSAQSSNCNAVITPSNTTVCSGSSVTLQAPSLSVTAPSSTNCSNGIGTWEQLFTSAQLSGYSINRTNGYAFDTATGVYYSVSGSTTLKVDLVNKTITSLSQSGAQTSFSHGIFNYSDQKLYAHRVGRDVVYNVPKTGGSWTVFGPGSNDANSYGSQPFYDAQNNRIGFFGGYGFYSVKNWVYESTSSGWINPYANNNNCNPARRNASGIAPSKDYKKMFIFSGQGNCNGSQTATSCTLGNAWASDVGKWCWLQDLYEYDFATNTFTAILPTGSSSISKEGSFAYNYDQDVFYILGGFTPPATWNASWASITPYTNTVLAMARGQGASTFSSVTVCGTPPPVGTVSSSSGMAFYDGPRDRIIWMRPDGIWALNLNTNSTSTSGSRLWSTGDTAQSISVTPTQTTSYWLSVTQNGVTCSDTVTIYVNNPNIQASANQICQPGDSVRLWISSQVGFGIPSSDPCNPPTASLGSDLLVWMPFCGNANDVSGNGLHGTTNGPTLDFDRFGNINKSYNFDGINDRITVPNNVLLNPNTITISAWIRPLQFGPSEQYIINKSFDPTPRNWSMRIGADGRLNIETRINGIYHEYWADDSLLLNTWNHVVLTYDGVRTKLYHNGTLTLDTAFAGTLSTSVHNLSIGYFPHNNMPPYGYFWNGHIDDIGIWGRALSQPEIRSIYGAQSQVWSTGQTTDTIWVKPTQTTTYWVQSTLNGVTCSDSVTISVNDVSIVASDTVVCANSPVTLSAGGSAQFNGTTGYISFPNSGPSGQSPRSFSLWFKTPSNAEMDLLGYGTRSCTQALELKLNDNLNYSASYNTNPCTLLQGVSTNFECHGSNWAANVGDNQWHHVVYVLGENGNYSYSNIKAYLDGNLISSGPGCFHNWGGWTYNTGSSSPMVLGKRFDGNTNYFSGNLDELSIWTSALTASDVSNLYQNGVSLTAPNLAHYYDFNTLTNGQVIDQIGTNHGTIQNGVTSSGTQAGTGARSFLWSTGDSTSSITVTPGQTTTYWLTTTSNGVSCVDSVTITVVNPTIQSNQTSSCGQDSILLWVSTLPGSQGAATLPYGVIGSAGIYVGPNGDDVNGTGSITSPFKTIQKGISVASNGQRVNVLPGTYSGSGNTNLSLQGKSIMLQSTSGPDQTIIDGMGTTNGFLLNSGESVNTVVRGFTIKNCVPTTKKGSAFFVEDNSGISIRACIFIGNTVNASGIGDVIALGDNETSGPQSAIDTCIFYQNTSGLIHSSKKSWYARYCLAQENTSQGELIGNGHDAGNDQDISFCVFRNNVVNNGPIVGLGHAKTLQESFFIENQTITVGSIYMGTVWSGTNIVDHCTFYNNIGTQYSSNWYDHIGQVKNSVFYGATGLQTISGKQSAIPFTYSNGTLPAGTGNTSGNPLFVNPTSNDFSYQNGSPCLNSGIGGTNQGATSTLIPSWLWSYGNSSNSSTTQWSTGESTDSIWVTPQTTTTYHVTRQLYGVQCADSIRINVNSASISANDSTVCLGDSLMLSSYTVGDSMLVYMTDFNSAIGAEWSNTTSQVFNGSGVLGPLGNTSLDLLLTNLPIGDSITVEFDLYIHDSWDGAGDTWSFGLNQNNTWSGQFSTNFNNHSGGNQAYPGSVGSTNPSKSGALSTTLARRCFAGTYVQTTHYRIRKKFLSNQQVGAVRFISNTDSDVCDESWSLENLKIWTGSGGITKSLLWSTGDTTPEIWVSPLQTTTYTLTNTTNGVSCTDSFTVYVNNPSITASHIESCSPGDSILLSVGAIPYTVLPGLIYKGLFNGHHYYLSNYATDWNQAVNFLNQYGGQLVSINTAAEQAFINSFGISQNAWIGGSDAITEGIWILPDGTTMTFSNWASGEPNNFNNEDYIEFYTTGQWNDIPPGINRLFIGEFNQGPGITWSTGSNSDSVWVTPTQTTSYWVQTTLNGVTCSDSITITVSTAQIAPIDSVICLGEMVTISAADSSLSSYLWSTGDTSAWISVQPTQTTSYWLTTLKNGQTCSDTVTIYVNDIGLQASTTFICAPGDSVLIWTNPSTVGASQNTCFPPGGTLNNGLLAWYPFCGNAQDASGNGNHGTVSGASPALDRFGSTASAFDFDGVNDHIQASVANIPTGNSARTFAGWIYTDGTNANGGSGTIYHHGAISYRQRDCMLQWNNQTFSHIGEGYDFGGGSLPYGVWQHVAYTHDGGTANLYVNGILRSQSNRNYNTAGGDLFLGFNSNSGHWNGERFNGRIDDFGAWNRALTAVEIQQLMQSAGSQTLWSTGETSDSIWVTPTKTTTYAIQKTLMGQTCLDSVTIFVASAKIAAQDTALCFGGLTSLSAQNTVSGQSYLWSTGDTTVQINVSPTQSTQYTLTTTLPNGLQCLDSLTVHVNNPSISASDTVICSPGDSVLLWVPYQVAGVIPGSWGTGQSSFYSTNFNSGIDPNWSSPTGSLPFSGNRVGPFGAGTLQLNLNNLPCHDSLRFNCLLQLDGSWDGNGNHCCGPDVFNIIVDGSTVFSTTFSMTQWAGNMQSYPAQYYPSNPVNNPQGTGSIGNNNYLLSFNFPHTTSSIEFKLAQPASQGAADEAWYFDNFNLELFECGAGGATIWSTGQGGDSIWVKPTQTTTYWVKRWMQGIECSDTIRVHVSNLQQTFNPFADTVIVCDTNAVLLNAGAGYTAYSWSDGSTDSTKTVLSTGYQSITVTDSLGCQATDSVWIYFSDLTAFLSKNNDVSCFGGSNGSIALTASGGQPPYAITWSTGQTGINSLTNLGAGVYWVTVTDALGCLRGDTVAVGQPTAPLSVNLAVLNVSCFGGNNGSVISAVSGGTAPYTYNWNTNPVQSGSSVNGLAAGSYTLTITDANGCVLVANATVTEPAAPLTASVSGSNVGCFGAATGSASVVASGGISPYSYSWNTVPVQTTAAAVGLSSGTYSVTVTDANGCTSAQSITITQPSAPLSASVIATSVNCFGGTSGTASAIPSGGTGPYSFIWNTMPAQTGQTATNLAAGTYTVIVTDANNCSTTQSVSVTQPIGPLVLVPTSTPVACFGDSTGSAGVLVTGGTAPYSYQWPSLPGITANTANNLSAGTYSVIVTDAKGCVQQTSVVVTQPSAPLSGTATVTNVNCYGDATGSISISMVGGTSPYTFNWSSLPGFSSANATNLTAGTYTVTATDANGCTFPLNVTVTQPSAPLMVATSGTNALCFGEASGSAQVAATGGTAPYSYSWNSNPAQNTAAATGLLAGTYTVIVTDANGCSEAAVWTVNQPMPLMATEVINDVSCRGAQDGSIQLSISGGTGAYYVLWPNGMTSPNRYQLGPGTYSYTVRDENNCTFIGTAIVDEPEPFKVQVDTTSPKCISTEDGAITVSASGGNGGLTYFINGELFNGMASGLGVFPYSIQIVDQNGCDTSFVVDLEPVYEPCVEIPNWFSPNSNGANDLWIIQGFEWEQLNLIVFNVFGQIVYETNSDNYVPWDGTYLGEPLPNGDYYYVMTSKDQRKYYSGYVTILR